MYTYLQFCELLPFVESTKFDKEKQQKFDIELVLTTFLKALRSEINTMTSYLNSPSEKMQQGAFRHHDYFITLVTIKQ